MEVINLDLASLTVVLGLLGPILLVLLVGVLAIKLILHFEKKILKKSKLDESVHRFILKATKVGLWVVLIIAILSKLGLETSSLIAVLGAGGAAIALALKDSLGNVAGGILILINQPFCKGDTIELAGVTGVVDSIDLMTTQLHTFDNKVVTIPNGTITTEIMTNYSREEIRRVDCQFSIGYDADIVQAKEILYNVAACNGVIMQDREPIIGVAAQGESGILLDLKVWCSTSDYFDVKYYLEENVKIAFDEAGINIPYNTMDVHIIK